MTAMANSEYLSAAMEWLRLRLQEAGGSGQGAGGSEADLLPPAPCALRPAADRVAALETAEPRPRIMELADIFGLSPFDRKVLLLCAAMELDTRIPSLCARAHGDPAKTWPTFGLALTIFHDDAAWESLSPAGPLRAWRLVDVVQNGHPLTTSPLRADERIVHEIKGLSHFDDRLAPYLFPLEIPPDDHALPPSMQRTVEGIAEFIQSTNGHPLPILQLDGGDRESKQLIAAHVAGSVHCGIVRLVADLLPPHASEVELLARLWNREALLQPLALYVDARNGDEPSRMSMRRFLLRVRGLVFLDSAERVDVANMRMFRTAKPEAEEQRSEWRAVTGDDDTAKRLASHFDLGMPQLRRIAAELHAAPEEERASRAWSATLAHMPVHLGSLAQKIECKATWDDIVLPPQDLALLRRIARQAGNRSQVYDDWGFRRRMNRGLGISALFVGESGTGKTMGAEVIANDLGLDLYRIDLANILNKFYGETEKNLAKLLDEAENGNVVLFFDEAESLFGRRVESRDSHDRYANMEVAYLLQRLESYSGLAILATNKRNELDSAFLRRIRFIVNFPFPGINERRELWKRALPEQTPASGIDYDRLAKLNVAGGNVHTIVLNAAFAAANAGTPVTMPLLLEAARIELRKLEKPINESELRWTEELAS